MENMTVAQLKEIANQKGIAFNSKTTKAQLIASLQTAEQPAKTGRSFTGEY